MARIFTFRDITIKGTTTLQKESCLRRGCKVSSIANQLTQIKLPDDTLVSATQIDCNFIVTPLTQTPICQIPSTFLMRSYPFGGIRSDCRWA